MHKNLLKNTSQLQHSFFKLYIDKIFIKAMNLGECKPAPKEQIYVES